MAGRLGPENWFKAARRLLKEKGPQAVAIREMGESLGVSTGSFYHHFENRQDFIIRFLEDWSGEAESATKELVTGTPETLDQINRRVNELLDHRLEAAIRAWSLFDDLVAGELARVDNRRRKALARLYEQHVPAELAQNLANLHLCALAGAQFVFMNHPGRLRTFGSFVNASARRLAGD